MIGGKELEQILAHGFFLLIKNCIASGVDEHLGRNHAGQRRDLAIQLEGVGHSQRIRMAGDRNDVLGLEDSALLQDLAPHFGQREPVGCRIEFFQAACVLYGLKGHAAHAGLLQCIVNNLADLVIVQSFLQSHNQIRRYVVAVQLLHGLLTHAAQVSPAQGHQRLALKGIKLQVDLKIFFVLRQPPDKIFFLGDAHPVGVHHQMADGPRLSQLNHFEEIRMHRWLAARELHHIRPPFVAHDRIEHLFDQRQIAELLALRAARGVTHRTAQVAIIADFHQRQAGVLLVVAAQTAIIRTPPAHGRVVDQRHLRGLDEDFARAAVVLHVIGNEHTLVAVLRTALEQIDLAVLKDRLGFDLLKTL